jgi:type IV secretory pathway VirB9-like protein
MIFLFSVSAIAGVRDELEKGKESSAPGASADQIMEMKIDLKKVQKAFNKSKTDANTKTYQYASNLTYKIRLREYMVTTVILPLSESILSYTLGDTYNFSFSLVSKETAGLRNIFKVWAKYPGADTNLVVIGESGNIYSFYLRCDSVESEYLPDLVIYIEDVKIKEAAADSIGAKPDHALPDYLEELPITEPSFLNYGYYIKGGDKTISPEIIYDDGYYTYFKFGKSLNKTKLPVVYMVVDGYDTPVNTRIKNGCIIAESTSDKWTLRRGEAHLCVWSQKAKASGQKRWLKWLQK